MEDFKQWLDQTKSDKPFLHESIEKLESFFNSEGFLAKEFESKIEKGLKIIETRSLQNS